MAIRLEGALGTSAETWLGMFVMDVAPGLHCEKAAHRFPAAFLMSLSSRNCAIPEVVYERELRDYGGEEFVKLMA